MVFFLAWTKNKMCKNKKKYKKLQKQKNLKTRKNYYFKKQKTSEKKMKD